MLLDTVLGRELPCLKCIQHCPGQILVVPDLVAAGGRRGGWSSIVWEKSTCTKLDSTPELSSDVPVFEIFLLQCALLNTCFKQASEISLRSSSEVSFILYRKSMNVSSLQSLCTKAVFLPDALGCTIKWMKWLDKRLHWVAFLLPRNGWTGNRWCCVQPLQWSETAN